MKNTHFTRKTILIIAFLYSFFMSAQQNDIEDFNWEGDIHYCTINNNSVTCNTKEAITIFISREDTAEITWEFNIKFPETNEVQSFMYIYPVINGYSDFEQYQKFKIVQVKQNKSVSFEGSSEMTFKENNISIYAQLDNDNKWLIKINDKEFEEFNEKSKYSTTKGFAITFKNMKDATISDIKIKSSNSEENNTDPEKPEPDNPDKPNNPEPDNYEGTTGLNYGDIVISEVMANPKNCPGYPEIEYIEIYNRTDSTINLSGWKIRYGKTGYDIPYSFITPKQYIILSHEKYAEEWDKAGIGNRIDMERFPVLANSGKQLFLSDSSGKLIAYTFYNETRYNNNAKSNGGFSLERIDNNNVNDSRHNWSASDSPLGGTPGTENSVKGKCEIKEPASFLYYEIIQPDTIIMYFSSPLDATSATDKNNYSITSDSTELQTITIDSLYLSTITITTTDRLKEDETIYMSPQNIKQTDLSEVIFPETISIAIPYRPEKGDLVFNEILFDNDSETCEFVEIYNTTEKHIELGNLVLSVLDEDGKYGKTSLLCNTNRVIEPGCYIAFTSDTIKLNKRWNCNIWNISLCNLPALRNDGGIITLLNGNIQEIDAAVFTPSIYPKTGKGSKGISAEKVNPSYTSSNPANWLPATAQTGYGTPGKKNSQFRENSLTAEKGKFTLQEDFITPNQDGQNDYATINYSFDDGGYIINIKVYSSSGREVAYPVKRETLASYGSIIWDGKDNEGNYLKPGIYILLIEAHNEKGDSVKQKIAIAIN